MEKIGLIVDLVGEFDVLFRKDELLGLPVWHCGVLEGFMNCGCMIEVDCEVCKKGGKPDSLSRT